VPGRELRNHAIVGGYGHLGSRIAQELVARGCQVVVVDREAEGHLRPHIEAAGCRPLGGDLRDDYVLTRAGVDRARCFLATTGDDRTNLEAGILARQLSPRTSVIVSLFDQTLASRVERAFDLEALSPSYLSSPAFIATATDDSLVAALRVDDCHLGFYRGDPPREDGRVHGIPLRRRGEDLAVAERDSCVLGDACLMAAVQRPQPEVRPRRRPGPAARIAPSVISRTGLLRRLWLTWRRAGRINRLLITSLLAVAAVSTWVFSAFGGMHPLNALYFVVATLTTTGYGDINLLKAPAPLKAYGIVLMLAGIGLLAGLYAIIANYIVSARVEALLGRRPVHLRNHTLVVGLGKVGFQVAYDLAVLGEHVGAVEINDDSDNVQAARAMFPVVIGNAARASILDKARVDQARVIIAATDDPMLNLSIVLHARDRNPAIRTIMRTHDVALAARLESLGLDGVLSTSAIAAPAFVDAALYQGVEGSFQWGDQDAMVARVVVGAASPLAGKTVAEVGDDLGVAVLLLAEGEGADYRPATAEDSLKPGHKVVLLVTRAKLDALPVLG